MSIKFVIIKSPRNFQDTFLFKIGSYFGASVCAVDLNNDGKDDLLIGAPQFAKIQDEGRVFVYMNRPCLLYTSPSPRDQRGSRMPSSA